MKKITFGILPSIAMGTFLLTGCVSRHHAVVVSTGPVVTEPVTTRTTRTVVVTEEPPAPRVEIETAAPDEAHVWIQGYWVHADNSWVWAPGHWELRPRVHAVWVPGHWDANPEGKGWIWTPGHWD